MRLKSYLKLLYRFARIRFFDWTAYRFSFLLGLLMRIAFLMVWLVFWTVVFLRKPTLAGWTWEEIVVLSGFSSMQLGFFGAFFTGFWGISRAFLGGGILEKYLTRPTNPLFCIVLEGFIRYNAFASILVGAATIWFATSQFGLHFTLWQLMLSFTMCFIGELAFCIMFGVIGCLTPFIGKVESLLAFLSWFDTDFTTYPLDSIQRNARLFLTFGIPTMFLSTFPTMILTNKMSLPQALEMTGWLVVLFIFWSLVLGFAWRKALRRYESFGG